MQIRQETDRYNAEYKKCFRETTLSCFFGGIEVPLNEFPTYLTVSIFHNILCILYSFPIKCSIIVREKVVEK